MNKISPPPKRKSQFVHLTINGQRITARPGSTVLEAGLAAGIYIPNLCYEPRLQPFGACRLCIVEIEGQRGFPTACTTPIKEGMKVYTETEEIQKWRRMIVELALSHHPYECPLCSKSQECQLLKVARYVGVNPETMTRLRRIPSNRPPDRSNPAFDFEPDKCILCGKCVRWCIEIVGVGAIDFCSRGYDTIVSPFAGKPIIQSICQSCGECVEHCPTGALSPKNFLPPEKEIETICPYCGVGCSLYLGVRLGRIVRVRGNPHSPVNGGELCVKGRYGLDFVSHPHRLKRPLVRREGVPKIVDIGDPSQIFEEVDWEKALAKVEESLRQIRHRYHPETIGLLSSAKCTNEENYLFQKFARAVLGTNNVDHCARLCHASTVAAALAAFGDGAMSNSIADIDGADVFLVIGSNTTECHPIIGRRIRRAVKYRGAKLIVADPRRIELCDIADIHLDHYPGTDVALLNGLMHQIIKENLLASLFISERCEDFEPFMESLKAYDLKRVEQLCGVAAEKIRRSALLFGKAKKAIILYGMGITQHTTGTDNVKAIANLLMLTGNLGRRGVGFSPLRGQNNVQGACDMGALPTFYPGYQPIDNQKVREKFEKAWGRKLSPKPGLTITEMIQAAYEGKLKVLYVMGENPMLSEPDLNHAKEALSRLEFLIVQDIFLTETALMADVILPAACFAEKDGTFTNTERRLQRVRKALDPPEEAKADWEIISEIATRLGYSMNYTSPAEIMDEIARLTPIYGGIKYHRLNRGGLQWPCYDSKHPGTPILHSGQFTRGRGKFHVVHDRPPVELPTSSFPLILTTGRILEHWHTGSMSHRSHVLETLVPQSYVEINHADAERLGIMEGDEISLASRRGEVQTRVKKSERVKPGQAFMAFHWREAPANRLTHRVFDPQAKIPELKVASIKAILSILERAAEDNKFLNALAENPIGALASYDLTPEHRRALAEGDIASIEEWVGPLEERLKVWLKIRLKQEGILDQKV